MDQNAIDEIFDKFQRRFGLRLRERDLWSGMTLEELRACEVQLFIVEQCMSNDGNFNLAYSRRVLKSYLTLIGEDHAEETLTESIASLFCIDSLRNQDDNWQQLLFYLPMDGFSGSWSISNCRRISLRVSSDLLSNGCTGYSLWTASRVFAAYGIEMLPEHIASNLSGTSINILELGCGVGLLGLVTDHILICNAKVSRWSMALLDCDTQVLDICKQNMNQVANLPRFQFAQLDFNQIDSSTGKMLFKEDASQEFIFSCDCAYDPSLARSLLQALKLLLSSRPSCIAFISVVVRREDTFQVFMKALQQSQLRYERIHLNEKVLHGAVEVFGANTSELSSIAMFKIQK
ncbi:hypothetical protein MP228_002297 [Amoeboaphelidium protococcarum]|nr:hypothetical protein MP228_002297 [Amoeboaphelidium protococcarum]